MTPLVTILLALWQLFGAQTLVQEQTTAVAFVDLYGTQREAVEAVSCSERRPTMHFGPGARTTDFVHALMHVADCLDDGAFNGSYGPPRPATPPLWLTRNPLLVSYCWENAAEWQACQAEYDPRTVQRWLQPTGRVSSARATAAR